MVDGEQNSNWREVKSTKLISWNRSFWRRRRGDIGKKGKTLARLVFLLSSWGLFPGDITAEHLGLDPVKRDQDSVASAKAHA